MNGLYIQTLGMIVTERCNINCKHCMRGNKSSRDMTIEVIEETLRQVDAIGHLAICGGEPTLAVDIIGKIFDTIVNNRILVDEVSTIINGVHYSKEFLEQLEYIDSYLSLISRNKDSLNTFFNISDDRYHLNEVKRLNMYEKYITNINMYKRSQYFKQMQGLISGVINEGNATFLNTNIVSDFIPNQLYICNYNGMLNIGPLVTIDTYGNITECDGSIENQQSIYKYGNIFEEGIKECCVKRAKKLTVDEWDRHFKYVKKR